MSTASQNIQSQHLIYDYLKGNILIEFLIRADNTMLSYDIQEHIRINGTYPNFNTLRIKSKLKISNKYNSDIYILIEAYDNTGKVGHATIHLIKNVINSNAHSGPVHIVNNQSNRRRQRLTVKQRNNSNITKGIEFIPGTCMYNNCTIINKMKLIMDSILYILNAYFNPSDNLSLTKLRNNRYPPAHIIQLANRIEQLNRMTRRNRIHYNRTQKMRQNMNNNRM